MKCSPPCLPNWPDPTRTRSSTRTTDRFYRAGTFTAPPGVYGLGSLVNPLLDPAFSNAGYFRVPFRAICRHYAHDRADLELAIAHVLQKIRAIGSRHVVFRGQTKEYTLGRSPELPEHLYGRPDAVEPSLLSSAERRTLKYAGWQALWSTHDCRAPCCDNRALS